MRSRAAARHCPARGTRSSCCPRADGPTGVRGGRPAAGCRPPEGPSFHVPVPRAGPAPGRAGHRLPRPAPGPRPRHRRVGAHTRRVRGGGRTSNVHTPVAAGVHADGHREILGIDVAGPARGPAASRSPPHSCPRRRGRSGALRR
ncbi:transposase [Streptomyces sp. NPDC003247]|uniref:transposase n=1 Tax=Streptomyces sp. NPDC003247 TaxID=3364677 RepID=UPI0036CC73D4